MVDSEVMIDDKKMVDRKVKEILGSIPEKYTGSDTQDKIEKVLISSVDEIHFPLVVLEIVKIKRIPDYQKEFYNYLMANLCRRALKSVSSEDKTDMWGEVIKNKKSFSKSVQTWLTHLEKKLGKEKKLGRAKESLIPPNGKRGGNAGGSTGVNLLMH